MARKNAVEANLEAQDEGALREADIEATPTVELIETAADAAPVVEEGAAEKDLAVEAYGLFCKGQSEGEYPAWEALPTQTQNLWRDGYQHVADGGKPRTDYEHAVKYLIVSAQ